MIAWPGDGKSTAGLIDLVGRGEIPGMPVLFALLGGQPAPNGYRALFR